MSDETYGQRLKSLRRKAKLTQQKLAAKLGTDTSSVSRWENDHGKPHHKQEVALAKLYGVSRDYLATGATHGDPIESDLFNEFLVSEYGRIATKNGWVEALRTMRLPQEPTTSELYIDFVQALLRDQRAKQRRGD